MRAGFVITVSGVDGPRAAYMAVKIAWPVVGANGLSTVALSLLFLKH